MDNISNSYVSSVSLSDDESININKIEDDNIIINYNTVN